MAGVGITDVTSHTIVSDVAVMVDMVECATDSTVVITDVDTVVLAVVAATTKVSAIAATTVAATTQKWPIAAAVVETTVPSTATGIGQTVSWAATAHVP